MEKLIVLKSKKDDFRKNKPNCGKEVSKVKINEEKGSFIRKMPIFRWIYPKIMGKGHFFGALCAHKMLILLNFAQKSLSCRGIPKNIHPCMVTKNSNDRNVDMDDGVLKPLILRRRDLGIYQLINYFLKRISPQNTGFWA